MNRVPVIVRNPAFVEELEPDGDEVDPADIAPCISGNTQIITAPASEDEDVAEELIQETENNDEDEKMDDILEKLESSNVEAEELLKEMRDIISFLPEGTS